MKTKSIVKSLCFSGMLFAPITYAEIPSELGDAPETKVSFSGLTLSSLMRSVSNIGIESNEILTLEQKKANDLLTALIDEAEKVTLKAQTLSSGNFGCAKKAGEAYGGLIGLISQAKRTFGKGGALQHAIETHINTIEVNFQLAVDDDIDEETLFILKDKLDNQVSRLNEALIEVNISSMVFDKMGFDFSSSKKSARHLCRFKQTDQLVNQIEKLVNKMKLDVAKVKKFLEPALLPDA